MCSLCVPPPDLTVYVFVPQDIDRVVVRLEQIKNQHGEGALPLNKKKAVKTKWRALAKMSVLLGGFVPQVSYILEYTNTIQTHLQMILQSKYVPFGITHLCPISNIYEISSGLTNKFYNYVCEPLQ